MATTSKIIDIYHQDAFNPTKWKQEGIISIIHKVTQGTKFKDPKYKARKKAAKAQGFLWGAYHFATSADWEGQVNFFLDAADLEKNELVAFDWKCRLMAHL